MVQHVVQHVVPKLNRVQATEVIKPQMASCISPVKGLVSYGLCFILPPQLACAVADCLRNRSLYVLVKQTSLHIKKMVCMSYTYEILLFYEIESCRLWWGPLQYFSLSSGSFLDTGCHQFDRHR